MYGYHIFHIRYATSFVCNQEIDCKKTDNSKPAIPPRLNSHEFVSSCRFYISDPPMAWHAWQGNDISKFDITHRAVDFAFPCWFLQVCVGLGFLLMLSLELSNAWIICHATTIFALPPTLHIASFVERFSRIFFLWHGTLHLNRQYL